MKLENMSPDHLMFLSCNENRTFNSKKWNEYIKKRNENLKNRIKIDLKGINFRIKNISNANFINVDFSETDLTSKEFSNVDFSGADLTGSYLNGSDFKSVKFHNTNLSETDLTKTVFRESEFFNTIFMNVEFDNTKIIKSKFNKNVYLTGCNFSELNCSGGTKQTLEYLHRVYSWKEWYKDHIFMGVIIKLFWYCSNYGRSTTRVFKKLCQ